MMNIGLFETCKDKFNWNKLTKKVCALLVSLTYVYHDARLGICKKNLMYLHNLQGVFTYIR